jgi:hypothetical protein
MLFSSNFTGGFYANDTRQRLAAGQLKLMIMKLTNKRQTAARVLFGCIVCVSARAINIPEQKLVQKYLTPGKTV